MNEEIFTIYSKPNCPYCIRVKQLMEALKFKYVVYDLENDFTREEFYTEFGQGSTFPQVIHGSKHLGGCADTIAYLKENNMV